MKYDLSIDEKNIEAHVDIEHDIQKQQNGVFTFTIKLSNNKIVDYAVTEYVDPSNYLQLKRVVIEEHTVASSNIPRVQ